MGAATRITVFIIVSYQEAHRPLTRSSVSRTWFLPWGPPQTRHIVRPLHTHVALVAHPPTAAFSCTRLDMDSASRLLMSVPCALAKWALATRRGRRRASGQERHTPFSREAASASALPASLPELLLLIFVSRRSSFGVPSVTVKGARYFQVY